MISNKKLLEDFFFPLEPNPNDKIETFVIKSDGIEYNYQFPGFINFWLYGQNISTIFMDLSVEWPNINYEVNQENIIFKFKANSQANIKGFSNTEEFCIAKNSNVEISVPCSKPFSVVVLEQIDSLHEKISIFNYLNQNNFNLAQIKAIYKNYHYYYKHILFRDKTFEYLDNSIKSVDLDIIAKDFEKKIDNIATYNSTLNNWNDVDWEKIKLYWSPDYKNHVQNHFANKLFELQQGNSKLNFEKYFCKFKKIDDSYYVKKFYDADQMHLIRTSLNQGFNLLKYVNTSYDYHQMEQIWLGLNSSLDVSVYAKQNNFNRPIFNWKQMEQIRKGLEHGLDVSQYTHLASKSSLSDFDKTPTDLQDSKVINEYNKSCPQSNKTETLESKNINKCI
ncbi:hypothetical protein [Metamycoplasma hominis]|uniref:hypothetical protein n=1 Tax=Metamycoplasma hominis TaxID=2098 RepID=UPI0005CB7779|nr:hypothetical protein [Metamycoplasma hominis]